MTEIASDPVTVLWQISVSPGVRAAAALVACAAACISLWLVARIHRRRLTRIPIRIHVAGTRGKSTTVRMIAAALRAGGYCVLAKTTGTVPCVILPDGSERPFTRLGAATIREQKRFVAEARRRKVDVIAVECMAIQEEYLWALERFYIQATDLVVTNVRPDHYEELGSEPDAMAKALALTVPKGNRVILAQEAAVPALLMAAAAAGATVEVADEPLQTDAHAVNTALALKVAAVYGVDGDRALAGVREYRADVGVFRLRQLNIDGRRILFANAFSCNDTVSFEQLWHSQVNPASSQAVLLNHRSDRPMRTAQFLQALANLAPHAALFLVGGGPALRRRAIQYGFQRDRIHFLRDRAPGEVLGAITSQVPDGAVVWGVGNFRGVGEALTAYVERRGSPC